MHSVLAREEASEPQAWADIALYLNGLPVVATPKVGPGKRLVAAKATYQQWCASCHEDDARGDDDGFVPSLRNQHYAYLKHEMSAMAAGHRFALEAELRDFLATLEPDARTSVADYLSRMRGAVRDRASLRDDGSLSD
jgi:cytochrome c553